MTLPDRLNGADILKLEAEAKDAKAMVELEKAITDGQTVVEAQADLLNAEPELDSADLDPNFDAERDEDAV